MNYMDIFDKGKSKFYNIMRYAGYVFINIENPILAFFFRLIYGDKGECVTNVKNPLILESALSLAKKIRSQQIKAEIVMEAYIQRAKEVNPVINAIVAEHYTIALEQAREVDRLLTLSPVPESLSYEKKPLLGVPLSVKECFAWKGMPQTSGLMSRREMVADTDALVLERLKQAGMIPFASTNTSELCMWFESANHVYGRSKNAYDNTKIAGGSSGGEASLLSAGASVVGIGSDIGGSIRMPAFFNGIFGHKPSSGLVPNDGHFPPATGGQSELMVTGPLCRYAEDLAPVLRIMAGPNVSRLKLDSEVDMEKLVVYSMDDGGVNILTVAMDDQLKTAQRRAFDHLRTLGVRCENIKLDLMKYSLEMWSCKMAASQGPPFASLMAGNDERQEKVNCFSEMMRLIVGQSDHTLPAIMLGMTESLMSSDSRGVQAFLHRLQCLREQLLSTLGDDGVLLYPSHPVTAPYHYQPIFTPFNFSYTAIFNALGLPVTQVPLGLSRGGLPLGVQVVASPYCDHLSLAVALQLEKKFGGWVEPGAR